MATFTCYEKDSAEGESAARTYTATYAQDAAEQFAQGLDGDGKLIDETVDVMVKCTASNRAKDAPSLDRWRAFSVDKEVEITYYATPL